jgi:hypothetical protein
MYVEIQLDMANIKERHSHRHYREPTNMEHEEFLSRPNNLKSDM